MFTVRPQYAITIHDGTSKRAEYPQEPCISEGKENNEKNSEKNFDRDAFCAYGAFMHRCSMG